MGVMQPDPYKFSISVQCLYHRMHTRTVVEESGMAEALGTCGMNPPTSISSLNDDIERVFVAPPSLLDSTFLFVDGIWRF